MIGAQWPATAGSMTPDTSIIGAGAGESARRWLKNMGDAGGINIKRCPPSAVEPLDARHRAAGGAGGGSNDPAGSDHQGDRQAAELGAGERDSGNQRPAYATAAAQARTLGDVGGDGPARRAAATQAH